MPGVPQLVRRDVRRRGQGAASAAAGAGARQPPDAADAAEDEGATGDEVEEGADEHPEDEDDGDHDGAGRADGVISREHVDDNPRAAQEEGVEEGQHEHVGAAVAPVHGWETGRDAAVVLRRLDRVSQIKAKIQCGSKVSLGLMASWRVSSRPLVRGDSGSFCPVMLAGWVAGPLVFLVLVH